MMHGHAAVQCTDHTSRHRQLLGLRQYHILGTCFWLLVPLQLGCHGSPFDASQAFAASDVLLPDPYAPT